MTKKQVTVLLQGEELPPYHVDEDTLNNITLGEFLETMPHGSGMLIHAVADNRVSVNGREIDVDDWYTTTLAGNEIFIAILSGGVVAGL